MAAMTLRWTGATSGVVNLNTNWIDLATGAAPAGGRYPGSTADYDSVVLDVAPTTALAIYDWSALTALQSFRITPAYNTTVGLQTLKMRAVADGGQVLVDAAGAGKVELKGQATAYGEWIILSGRQVELDAKMQTLAMYGGGVLMKAGITVATTLLIGYKQSPTDVTLTIEAGATLPSSILALGGNVTCNVATTNLTISNGTWKQYGAITALITQGGILEWHTGAITAATIYGGKLDGSKDQTVRELTAATVYPAGSVDLDCGIDAIGIGAGGIAMMGGAIKLPPGMTITDV